LQHEQAALRFVLGFLDVLSNDVFLQRFGGYLVLSFDFFEVAEEFADAGVGDLRHRLLVEAAGLEFHHLGMLADFGDLQRTRQPEWPALHESLDVLTADQWNMLAEAGAISLNERGAMA